MVTEEEVIAAATPQKNEIHNSAGHVVSSDQDGNTPAVPKKPSEDGYSWRKYGQKNVKRNEFIRSYYKCSYHSCQVKKQVEHAHDGRITDTTYFGEHDHPKPLNNLPITVPSVVSVKVQIADRCPSTIAEDKSSSALALKTEEGELTDTNKLAVVETSTDGRVLAPPPTSETKDDDHGNDKLVLKRRKKGTDDAESVIDKHGSQSCHVVETVSVVDIVNDGYRWRKYGQKLVKGNLHPRSYYRCSNPGCPAKKRVERAFRDSKVVITTYEGKHDHEIPPVRTILPHGNSPSLCTPSEPNGAKKSNKRDLSVVVTEDDSTVSEKQQVDTSHHIAEEKQVDTSHHIAEEKKDVAITNPEIDAPTHDSSGSGSGSGDQQTPDNMMVGSGDQTPDSMMVVSSCQESNPKERQNPDSEPVSC